MDHNKYMTTGEFARRMGVTKNTLFHYDNIGLFLPEIVDTNDYRYYSIYQMEVFDTIIILKEMGMPLNEIKEFMDHRSPESLMELFEKEDKKELQEALKNYPSVDLALFGRMVADEPSLNYDAAAQVAHAISTHAVHNEYDYFTAVDDCTSEDNSGAGHLGTVEYNSSTLYRYATVNAAELANYLGGDTPKAVKNFAEAFITSMPTGKQNTFANRTRPDAVYVTVRRDQPVNMAGAFEKPVITKGGYVEQSIKALVDYAKESYEDYVNEPEMAFAVGRELESLATTMNLTKLLDELEKQVLNDLEEVKE